MGCNAPCELRPSPGKARGVVRDFFHATFPGASLFKMDKVLATEMEDRNVSEIYQLRGRIAEKVMTALEGKPPSEMDAASLAKRLKEKLDAIYICYAHQQHLFRGSDITNLDKRTKAGFAPQFEMVTKFPGRMAKAACSPDL